MLLLTPSLLYYPKYLQNYNKALLSKVKTLSSAKLNGCFFMDLLYILYKLYSILDYLLSL